MCGRFVLVTPPDQLARLFDAALAAGVDPERHLGYNIAPTQQVLGIVGEPTETATAAAIVRELTTFRWGLVPAWSKDPGSGPLLFNARAETAATKPSFRSAFAHRRMVVPADGFYEWEHAGSARLPYYFTRADGDMLAFAGIWERWSPRSDASGADDAAPFVSCSILTTAASDDVSDVHDRMPVVLERDTIDLWLDNEGTERGELDHLLAPSPAGTLSRHRVDRRVGNVANQGPELIEPAE